MKSKILIILFTLLALFIWSCDEEPPLGPETQDVELSKKLPVGTVTPVLSLDPGNSPEGIAVDWRGRMFISNTRNGGNVNEILRIKKNGTWEPYATLPGSGQVRGLVTDLLGNVYAAFATPDPSNNGVYRINRNGTPFRLKGSKEIGSPNSLTFDWKGNLYATDSYKGPDYEGAVWCYGRRDQKFKLLIKDPLLNGIFDPAFGDIPGANGIAFYPPNKLYVANTYQGLICRVKIGNFRNGATIELVKQDLMLSTIDGIAIDIYENIYGVLPGCTLGFNVHPLVKLNPRNGVITPVVTDNSLFDTPTSLAFGKGRGNWGSLFIANAALYDLPVTRQPGVVNVKVGVFGLGKQ